MNESSIIDRMYCRDKVADEIRKIAYLQLFNGTFAVCDYDSTRVYKSRGGSAAGWHELISEYERAGWSVEIA